jgi:hypothetical protein
MWVEGCQLRLIRKDEFAGAEVGRNCRGHFRRQGAIPRTTQAREEKLSLLKEQRVTKMRKLASLGDNVSRVLPMK